jgi:feruloyl esterase
VRRACLVIAIVGLSAVHPLSAQNGSQFKDWKAAALPDGKRVAPQVACASLVALTGYEFSVIGAAVVSPSADAPEYCRVSGQILPEIRFEVSLPASWNGRLYMFGNGGYAGEAPDSPSRVTTARHALARGFAVTQTNTGHDAAVEPLGTFASNPQKFLDYAFRAVHVTVVTAKRIAQAYYAAAPRHSYFDGCSTGGRQGLISAQRFPDDFDGILLGAPVLDFSGTMINYSMVQRALASAAMPPEKLALLGSIIYAKCDAVDGISDGVIDDPRRCGFSPSQDLQRCADDREGGECFTSGQVRALEAIYGNTKRGGEDFFPGWPVGAEIETRGPTGAPASAWMPWFAAAPNARPIQANFGESFFRNMAFGRPMPDYDWKTFDVEADLAKVQAARTALDATDPDLSRFKARGGKIVGYFGWADPALNPLMGVKYYESVAQRFGGATADFYRMFMVPGMFHCRGGVGVSVFDAMTPLVEWVEKGVAPPTILASKIVDGKAVRTRPLCPYPEVAKYKGSGSTDDATNFICARPAADPSASGSGPRR